ncbi:MAG TPA: MipA/OmpV family protein [Paucimonas sp.]|nr:MipA/OmpV family protein [Paucimonas sp.]
MAKIFFLALLGICNLAVAQTPSAPMMPDGSKDMYVGLGVASLPRYKGADERRTNIIGLVQMQWSNGVFVSGLNLGMHLSPTPGLEYGPLLSIEPGRNVSAGGRLTDIGEINQAISSEIGRNSSIQPHDIRATPQIGGFANYYLTPELRLIGSLLYGAGEERDGLLFSGGVQKSFAQVIPHHNLSLTAGVTWANRHYLREFFGLRPERLPAGSRFAYEPASSGIRDVQLTFNWNWELSNAWLLSTQLTASRLMGQAADSPLAERRNNLGFRTGLAYRF